MPPATCIFRSLPLSILRILSLKSHVVSRNCLEYYSLLLLLSIQSRVFRRNVQSSVILTIFTRKIRAQNERSPNGKNSSHRFLLALRPNARTNFLELSRTFSKSNSKLESSLCNAILINLSASVETAD